MWVCGCVSGWGTLCPPLFWLFYFFYFIFFKFFLFFLYFCIFVLYIYIYIYLTFFHFLKFFLFFYFLFFLIISKLKKTIKKKTLLFGVYTIQYENQSLYLEVYLEDPLEIHPKIL